MIVIERPDGDGIVVEIVNEMVVLELLDKLEAELMETRRRHDALPTVEHMQAWRLLEKLGRRNKARAHL